MKRIVVIDDQRNFDFSGMYGVRDQDFSLISFKDNASAINYLVEVWSNDLLSVGPDDVVIIDELWLDFDMGWTDDFKTELTILPVVRFLEACAFIAARPQILKIFVHTQSFHNGKQMTHRLRKWKYDAEQIFILPPLVKAEGIIIATSKDFNQGSD